MSGHSHHRVLKTSEDSTQDLLRWVRLCRVSQEVGVGEDTRQELRATLDGLLGRDEAPRKAAVGIASQEPPPSPAMVQRPDAADWNQCGLMIRHLVQADAPWTVVAPWVRRLLLLRSEPDAAANAVELAFLVGNGSDIEMLLLELRAKKIEAWFHIRPEVRSPLLVGLWREQRTGVVATTLYESRDLPQLTSVERLFVFAGLQRSQDPAVPWLFYSRFEKPIHEAVKRFGESLGLTASRFVLQIARLALDAGDHDAARRMAERIPKEAPERDEALRLLLDIATDRGFQSKELCVQQIKEEPDVKRRLEMMTELLGKVREKGGLRDRQRPAVNWLLGATDEWLPARSDLWRAWSRTLMEHRDLLGLLPDLFDLFVSNAMVFHTPDMDLALWEPLCLLPEDGSPMERYWRAMALCHRYVSAGGWEEDRLWEARGAMIAAAAISPMPVPYDWNKTHTALVRAVAKSPRLFEKERELTQLRLRMAGPRKEITLSDVSRYLNETPDPIPAVMESLESIAQTSRDLELEKRLLACRIRHRRYANHELVKLWLTACASESHDAAWRLATMMHARASLHPAIVRSWEVSGEKRREYAFSRMTTAHARMCLHDFDPNMAKFCEALRVVGPAVTELIAILDNSSRSLRWRSASGGVEREAREALDRAPWLTAGRKRYRFGPDAETDVLRLPAPFAKTLPVNAWSAVFGELCERLGAHSWGWRVSTLRAFAEEMIPGVRTKLDLIGRPGKVARWMKSLTPDERSAWNTLQRLSQVLEDETTAEQVMIFVTRLATLFYQNHYQGLTTLQIIRAPLTVLRGLETWVISSEYSRCREQLGTRTLMPVPSDLRAVNPLLARE